jgi:hypothetical protein
MSQSKTKKKILICDDVRGKRESSIAQSWRDDLIKIPSVKKGFGDPQIVGSDDFKKALKGLEERQELSRKRRTTQEEPQFGDNLFDDAAILLLDFDLFHYDSRTGEEIAYLARCYSQCGIIIALNQFSTNKDNPFDLTLKGHPDSFADLNLSGKQLSNPGLWEKDRTRWEAFRPWGWSVLPQAVDKFESRVNSLQSGDLKKRILSYFDFPDEVTMTLPRSTREFLSKKEVPDTTFEKFVTDSGKGLRPKDKPFNQESIARIAAARISKWLERLVLPGQDILVDAPHLVLRFPSLLKAKTNRDKAETWNKTASFEDESKLGINHQLFESEYLFKKADWLSRPAWYWNSLTTCKDIPEVKNPWSAKFPEFVFAEDTSCFIERDKAHEFVADLPSPFVRRFVAQIKKVEYVPSVRFSL